MRYGFMPDFNQDIFSEIEFAKENFDFIEITLELDLKKYSSKYITQIKTALRSFEILGHIHWEINLFNKIGLKKIEKSIKIFKKMGAKIITIHPSIRFKGSPDEIKNKNREQLLKLDKFGKRKNVKLLIENMDKPPFNSVKIFREVFPEFNITLDTGHADKTSKKELDNFLMLKKKVKHIHLHDSGGDLDHIAFSNNKLKRIISKIKKSGYNGTITLEIFRKAKDEKLIPLNKNERRRTLIDQLNLVGEH